MMHVQNSEKRDFVKHVKKLFGAMDETGSQTLTRSEFTEMLNDHYVIAYLKSLGVNLTEARGLFTLLDADHNDALSVEEFANGCIRMKGEAKAVDMVTMLYESKKM